LVSHIPSPPSGHGFDTKRTKFPESISRGKGFFTRITSSPNPIYTYSKYVSQALLSSPFLPEFSILLAF